MSDKREGYGLYLDDEREPKTPGPWICARTFNEFVNTIEACGLPARISFDHDLGDDKSGMDCAKWLVEYCFDGRLSLRDVDINVHSANPVGAENIRGLLESFVRATEEGYILADGPRAPLGLSDVEAWANANRQRVNPKRQFDDLLEQLPKLANEAISMTLSKDTNEIYEWFWRPRGSGAHYARWHRKEARRREFEAKTDGMDWKDKAMARLNYNAQYGEVLTSRMIETVDMWRRSDGL